MKYYKNEENKIYAFEDGYDDIPTGLVSITEEEANEIINPQSEKEKERVALIKTKANEVIEFVYPTFKQLNIIRLGGNDLIEMGIFIDSIRTISNEAKLNGTALEDINWTV